MSEVTYRPRAMEGFIDTQKVDPSLPPPDPKWAIRWDNVTHIFDSIDVAVASIQATYPSATISEEPSRGNDSIKVFDVIQDGHVQDRVTAVLHDIKNTAAAFPGRQTQGQEF